jgi:2-keto-4-pentenoate hydratase
MTHDKMTAAVDALVAARRSGTRIASLPEGSHPTSLGEALAIQDAVVAGLGERVAGWKVATNKDGEVMRGAIISSRMLQSPARLSAADVPLLGVEGEIAFLFDRAMPPRDSDYTTNEIRDAVTALAGIEIVASRFLHYAGAPLLDRTADCMSNGAFIAGMHRSDWRQIDLAKLEATLRVNDEIAVQKVGGHVAGDPILPAIALVNLLRKTRGVDAEQIITTGTFTGLKFMKPGDRVAIEFAGFGTAEVTLTR